MLIGNGVGFWKTIPTLARKIEISVLVVNKFSPSRLIWPSARWPGYNSYIRLKVRNKVDLPQPEGPIKAVTLLRGMRILTFLMA